MVRAATILVETPSGPGFAKPVLDGGFSAMPSTVLGGLLGFDGPLTV
jgi:hypothetical protein